MDNVFLNKMDHYLAYLAGDAKDFPDPTNQLEERMYTLCKRGLGGGSGSNNAEAIRYINDAINSGNVKEALDKIVSKVYYVKPSIASFTCVPNAGVYEIGIGKIPSIKFTWAYNKDITTQSLSGCTLANNTIREYTYNTELNSTKSFTLTASDGENSVTATKTFTFVYPTYYGVLDNNTITSSNIISKCTKLIRAKTEYKGVYTTNKQSVVFASPWAVKSIINQNNYEVISSFNLDRITINGCSYYVYSLPDVTINNFAYTFKY